MTPEDREQYMACLIEDLSPVVSADELARILATLEPEESDALPV